MSKSKYDSYTKEQLIEKIKKLEKQRYGLVWEDKEEAVAKECETNLPVLEEDIAKQISKSPNQPTNFIFEGDNFHSLYTLNFTHKKKIDIIYIDPPYNTGNKSWRYNNDYVDSEDPYKHSKWISFMNKRLRLAKNLLKDTGVLVLTIDDYEIYSIGLLLDKIFGEKNKIGVIAIETNPRGRTTNKFFATSHEYILFYAKNIANAKTYELPLNEEQKLVFKYEDEMSFYRLLPFRRSGGLSTPSERPNSEFPIFYSKENNKIIAVGGKRNDDSKKIYTTDYVLLINDNSEIISISYKDFIKKFGKESVEIMPIDSSGNRRVWRWSEREKILEAAMQGDFIINTENGKYNIQLKDRIKKGRKAKTIWVDPKYDASSNGTVLIEKILGKSKSFDYPKSLYATLDTLNVLAYENKNALILDFFAGSGTTGQAVLELNQQDGGNRQFILCTNNENNICQEVTYPRIKKVIDGYADKKGIPANVKYFKTTFVPNVITNNDKRVLVARSTELLCIAENTFEIVKQNKRKQDFIILKNSTKHTAIIYDEDSISNCCNELNKLGIKQNVVIYVFSYDHTFEETDFENLNCKFTVKPIPEAILNVYRKIAKQKK